MSAPTTPPGGGGGRAWTWLRWLAVGTVAAYLLSFGPVVWYANMTTQAPFRAQLMAVIAPLYAPHLWLAGRFTTYGDYCRWWQNQARRSRAVP